MPIYEYQCQACGGVREVMQKLSDPAPDACPICSQGPLVKLMSRTAFVLKGSGWYVTDFRGGKKPDASGDAAAPAADSAKSDAAKPAAAPAASEASPSEAAKPKAAEPAKAESSPAKSSNSSP